MSGSCPRTREYLSVVSQSSFLIACLTSSVLVERHVNRFSDSHIVRSGCWEIGGEAVGEVRLGSLLVKTHARRKEYDGLWLCMEDTKPHHDRSLAYGGDVNLSVGFIINR